MGVDVHHIKSRGAGGGDTVDNVIPLCRSHHTEIHKIGPTKMMEKYWSIKTYLSKG